MALNLTDIKKLDVIMSDSSRSKQPNSSVSSRIKQPNSSVSSRSKQPKSSVSSRIKLPKSSVSSILIHLEANHKEAWCCKCIIILVDYIVSTQKYRPALDFAFLYTLTNYRKVCIYCKPQPHNFPQQNKLTMLRSVDVLSM